MCICLSVCMYICCWRPEEVNQFPGTGVTGSCDHPMYVLGVKLQPSGGTGSLTTKHIYSPIGQLLISSTCSAKMSFLACVSPDTSSTPFLCDEIETLPSPLSI